MLDINTFTYDLPPEKIAQFPLSKRDDARLLVYRDQQISHRRFHELAEVLPPNAALFFNDTRVIPARLQFQKETGAGIEVFLLNPTAPSPVLAVAMQARERCTWKCTIGNLKRWPAGTMLEKPVRGTTLRAILRDRGEGIVEFEWDGDQAFAEVIVSAGETPLPPYLKRAAREDDKERYQTVYSQYEGAVAAPTAGLHFTPEVLDSLRARNILMDFLTLHVSAGTFQPVKHANADEHVMHSEQVVVSQRNIENLLTPGKVVIPVGTTSMRTLESLYWYGVNLINHGGETFAVKQDDPYIAPSDIPTGDALNAVWSHLRRSGRESIIGTTSIFIKPGYKFRVCDGLVTNFHQPASTLILLVAAFVGENWRKIYGEALNNGYRFLSYGDSSLLVRAAG